MTTPETLTRSEAARMLLAVGMPADVAADYLDHEPPFTARSSLSLAYSGAWPILAAYRRHCAAHEGIVERAIRLDREATARACGPDLTPAEDPLDTVPPEERERIRALTDALHHNSWTMTVDKGDAYRATIAREVAAYHTRQKDEARIAAVFGDKPRTMAQFHGPDAAPDDDSDPVLSPAEEASAPGQTPIGRPPSTIAAAFEAMLAFFICLIGPRPHRKITPAEEIGALAACEVEIDFTPDSPPTDLLALRDLIRRAAEEYERIRVSARERLDHVAKTRRERKAADLATAPVTDADLADIEARTSGPGPLAEDDALLRRCAAEIRRLRAWQKNAVQDIAAKTREWQQRGTEVRELDAEIDRWKTAVVSKAAERDVAVTENGRLRSEVERLTAKLAGIEGIAAQGDGMMATISEQAAEIERLARDLAAARAPTEGRLPDETLLAMGRVQGVLAAIGDPSERPPAAASLEALFAKWAPLLSPYLNGEQLADLRGDVVRAVRAVDASRPGLMCAECHRSVGRNVAHIDCEAPELGLVSDEHGYRAGSVDSAVATVVRAMGRPGLTEEEALATAGPLSRDIYNRIGLATGNKIGAPEWMRDAIAAALLRASRGAPGEVSIPRAILERLAKAAGSDVDAREARWAAERILQQTDLAAEPARTDAEAARALAKRGGQ